MIRIVFHDFDPPFLLDSLNMTLCDIIWPRNENRSKLSEVCLTWARQNYLSWYNNVDNKVRIALRAPLLIRCPETKKFYVNYDPEIDKILREAKYFERIGQQFEHAKGIVFITYRKFFRFLYFLFPVCLFFYFRFKNDKTDEYQLPQGAKDLLRRKDEVKNAKTQMEMCLKTFDSEIARIPTIFKPLFEKHERAVRLKINKV